MFILYISILSLISRMPGDWKMLLSRVIVGKEDVFLIKQEILYYLEITTPRSNREPKKL